MASPSSAHSTEEFFLRLPPTLELGQSRVFGVPTRGDSRAALTSYSSLGPGGKEMDGTELVHPDAWVVGVPAHSCAPGRFSQALSSISHATRHRHIAQGHSFSN